MRYPKIFAVVVILLLSACSDSSKNSRFTETVRFATFHVDMAYDHAEGYTDLLAQARAGDEKRFANLAAIIQQDFDGVRPDVLLLTGFSTLVEEQDQVNTLALERFQQNYLSVSQGHGLRPIEYAYSYVAATNSGQRLVLDVNGDGTEGRLPEDAKGYGHFHGQNSFVILSRFRLDESAARTFRDFKWSDVRDAQKPSLGEGKEMDDEVWQTLPLMDTNLVDIPLVLPDGRRISLVATQFESPMSRDDSERPFVRNRDQLLFLKDYLDHSRGYGQSITDDRGVRGGISQSRPFIVLGRLQSDEDSYAYTIPFADKPAYPLPHGAMRRLLSDDSFHFNSAYNSEAPMSDGALEYSGFTDSRHMNPEIWTSSLGIRQDFVLPAHNLSWSNDGVFWPAYGHRGAEWVSDDMGRPQSTLSSEGRLVWVDINLNHSF